MSEKEPDTKKKATNQVKDEKQKKKLDIWGYRLAWLGFAGSLLIAFYNLARKSETPKENDFYR